MATMTVEQGKCEIYPSKQDQMCVHVNVLVTSLKLGAAADGDWVVDGTIRNETVQCGQLGLDRLLGMIDKATKPPTKRQKREATSGA